MSYYRRRGTALVDTSKGILVVAGRRKLFITPGGGANKGESRKKATIRELREETGLKTYYCKYLFKWYGGKHKTWQDCHKIFLIKAEGHARPRHEVKYITYWKPNSKIRLSYNTQSIINKYLNEYK